MDKEILTGFIDESKGLLVQCIQILEKIEDEVDEAELRKYGNFVDRIMGGAKSIATFLPPDHSLHLLSDMTELCKAVSYKASYVKDNSQLATLSVALLFDVTEALENILEHLDQPRDQLLRGLTSSFMDRLKWIAGQFDDGLSGTLKLSASKNKTEIEALITKLSNTGTTVKRS